LTENQSLQQVFSQPHQSNLEWEIEELDAWKIPNTLFEGTIELRMEKPVKPEDFANFPQRLVSRWYLIFENYRIHGEEPLLKSKAIRNSRLV